MKRMGKIAMTLLFATVLLVGISASTHVLNDSFQINKRSITLTLMGGEPGPGVGGWDSTTNSTTDEPGPGVGGWDSLVTLNDEPGPGVGGWDSIARINDEPGPGVGGWDSVPILFDGEPGPSVGGWD